MTYNLFLDDYRIPYDAFIILRKEEFLKEQWVIVRSHNEFVDKIKKDGLPNMIAFDHDLADEHYKTHDSEYFPENYLKLNEDVFSEKTGYDSAQWLVDYCMDNKHTLPKYFVHSMNPAGRANIQGLLDNFKKFQERNAEAKD